MSNLESTITASSVPEAIPLQLSPSQDQDLTDLIEEHILPRLDPDFLHYFLDVLAKSPPGHKIDLKDMRANPDKYRAPWAVDTSEYERVSDYKVTSEDGATIPVRVYHPDPQEFGDGPYGAHLNFHGRCILSVPPCHCLRKITRRDNRGRFRHRRLISRGTTMSQHA